MRTETVEYKVYKFEELSDAAKKKVIEELRDINIWDDWHEYTIEDFKEDLTEVGFENPEVCYSGFCSQGDGASFDARCNIEKLVKTIGDKRFKPLVKLYRAGLFGLTIEKTSFANHYSHEKTRYITEEFAFNCDKHRKLMDLGCRFQSYVESLRRDWCQDIYHKLEREYDYLTSEEAIKETIEANGYEFLESGKIF